jgi:hypothetical protein
MLWPPVRFKVGLSKGGTYFMVSCGLFCAEYFIARISQAGYYVSDVV